jgi:hypothetical protein
MDAGRLQEALVQIRKAISELEAVLDWMRAEHDPLAVHIFLARRQFRNAADTKSGKRRETAALITFKQAVDLGFRGRLGDWQRLLGAAPPGDEKSEKRAGRKT